MQWMTAIRVPFLVLALGNPTRAEASLCPVADIRSDQDRLYLIGRSGEVASFESGGPFHSPVHGQGKVSVLEPTPSGAVTVTGDMLSRGEREVEIDLGPMNAQHVVADADGRRLLAYGTKHLALVDLTTGKRSWTVQLPAPASQCVQGGARSFCVLAMRAVEARLLASGESAWAVKLDSPATRLEYAHGRVLAFVDSGVIGLEPETGKAAWTTTEPEWVAGVMIGSAVYAVTARKLMAFSIEDGRQLFDRHLPPGLKVPSLSFGRRGLYVTGRRSAVVEVMAGVLQGHRLEQRWVSSFKAEEAGPATTMPTQPLVVTVTDQSSTRASVHGLDRSSGQHLWRLSLPAPLDAVPVGKRFVAFRSEDGEVAIVDIKSGVVARRLCSAAK